MSHLLDTHALLWWLFDDPRLSEVARGILSDPGHAVFVSAASGWEIATKYRLGKLDAAGTLVQDLPGWVVRAGFGELPVTLAHAQRAGAFPHEHRDPFDRMIAAQGLIEGLPVVSRDAALDAFGIRRVW